MEAGDLEVEKTFDNLVSDEKIFDIRERSFAFAVRIVKLCDFLENHSKVSKNLIRQLLNAGTSVGANLEEAQGV